MRGGYRGTPRGLRPGKGVRLASALASRSGRGGFSSGLWVWCLLDRMLLARGRSAGGMAGLIILMLCMAAGGALGAEPTGRALTFQDIVKFEAFGRASISPDDRWAVYERRGPYDTSLRYDLGARSTWTIMKLRRLDLSRQGSLAEPLLEGDPSVLLCGPWSPGGRRLVICRLAGGTLELGVVDMVSREVLWSGVTPELPLAGASTEWVDEERLVIMSRPDGSLPWLLRFSSGSQVRAAEDWARTAAGATPSRAVLNTRAGVISSEIAPADQSLILLDAVTGHRETLATGQIADFSVSPDGSRLAIVESGAPIAAQPGSVSFSGMRFRQRLRLLGLEGQSPIRFDADLDVGPGLLRWSPRSQEVLAWGRRDGEAWEDGQLVRLGADGSIAGLDHTGLAPLDPERGLGSLAGIRADWLGASPVLYARAEDGSRFDWYVVATDHLPHAITAQMQVPPSRLSRVTEEGALMVADGGVWFTSASETLRLTPAEITYREMLIGDTETPFRQRINSPLRRDSTMVMSADGALFKVGREGKVVPVGSAGAPDRRMLATSTETALSLSADEVVEDLIVSAMGTDHSVDRVNKDFADIVRARPLPIPHADSQARAVVSQLFLPMGRSLAEVRGVIVLVYPGSVSTGTWQGPFYLTYGLRAEVLAGSGYAVLSPAIPHDPSRPPTADDLARGVDLAVDALFESYPDLLDGRLAVAGHSFGGGTALLIATRSDRYRAYVAWAGFSDLFGQWGEFSPVNRQVPEEEPLINRSQAWVETGQARMGGPPWTRPDAYIGLSPFMAADRIKDPVLLIAGDRDFVPVTQAERMFSALYRLGEHSRLVTYWGEDHFNWSPANICDVYLQILEWLEMVLASPTSPVSDTACGPVT